MRIILICLIVIQNLNFNTFAKEEVSITDEEILRNMLFFKYCLSTKIK